MDQNHYQRREFLRYTAALSSAALWPLEGQAQLIAGPASNKRIAAIVTTYHRYSHADDIVTRFMEGFSIVGKSYAPPCRVASLYIDQVGETDIGRPLAKQWKIPVVSSIAEALTLGGDKLAVDGVLLVAEQGNYPLTDKGQIQYPRRKMFEQIVQVFRRSGRSVPVYNDKHFSYSWADARWMYDQSKEMGFPMMAGSSVPVSTRHPDLRPEKNVPWVGALSIGYGNFETYGFHALEGLQVMTECRPGGETGVRAVQCLEGKAAWDAARAGAWDRRLLEAALARIPGKHDQSIEEVDANAIVYLIEYNDGLRTAAYMSPRYVREFAFAGQVKNEAQPRSCWYELPKPQRDHFSYLVLAIAQMMTTGKPAYPVERTLLTTGMLAFLIDSKAGGHPRIETPQLAVKYAV